MIILDSPRLTQSSNIDELKCFQSGSDEKRRNSWFLVLASKLDHQITTQKHGFTLLVLSETKSYFLSILSHADATNTQNA